jgi:hypothetical protein
MTCQWPKAEVGTGGTGNVRVPLGHWPNGMGRSIRFMRARSKLCAVLAHSARRVAARDGQVARSTHPGPSLMEKLSQIKPN